MRPEEQAKSRQENALPRRSSKALVTFCAKSALSFVAPHVKLIDSQERRESNSRSGKAAQHNTDSSFDLATSLAGATNSAEVMEFQEAYWRKQLDILTAPPRRCAYLLRNLAAPIKPGREEFRKTSWI